jgi:LAS superfamily LD-carboxypeptidase LdcB
MSWAIFKRNMSSFMANPNGVKSPDAFAQTLATEYEAALKRGYDQLNFVSILGGDVQLLTSLFSVTLQSGNFRRRQYDVMAELGKGVVLYWSTVQFNSFPPPVIPAPGSVSNLSIQSSVVLSPGVWIPTPPPLFLRPSRSSDSFIDNFITSATKHLQTVGGSFFTVSIYPPIGTPGPGILPWSGYFVPPDTSVPITERDDDTSVAEGIEVSEYEKSTGTEIPKEQPIPRKPQSSNVSKRINVQKSTNTSYTLPSVTTSPVVIPTSTSPEAIQRLQSGPSPQVYRNIGATAYPKPPGLASFGNGLLNERILVPIGPNGQRRYGGQFLLHPEAADSFFKLKQQAKEDGIGFTITSAYRNVEHQGGLGTGAGVAGAGRSPHGWGGALDFGELYRAVGGSTSPVKNRQAREASPLYRWLSINGPKYGWYNPWRLADGAGVDEIWHWEYWGFFI